MAIVLSCISLVLSAFTFYWTSLRSRRAFFLIRLDSASSIALPQFALVNGGKADLLITSLKCFFEKINKSGSFCPSQRISFQEGNDMLLQAGKAFHCKVEFVEKFIESFVVNGERAAKLEGVYLHTMMIEVQWVEMNGTLHQKVVPHSRIGFDTAGEFRVCMPLGSKHDLFAG